MDRVKKLYKAALEGDVHALRSLVQEDPLLLQRIDSTSAAGNPLHVASLRGDVDFAKELLKLRPELAGMRDEGGSYPIHLAAAGGHVGVVLEILGTKSTSSRRAQDKDGRTALHLAAANGRVEVVRELLRVDPELAGIVSNRGETALHMCVRNNQVEAAAEVLVGCKAELVNAKDSEGNTVLHLATARKQFKMLELFLSKTQVDVKATNGCDCTALDILSQGPSDYGDMEISLLLSKAGCNIKRKTQQNSSPTNARKKRWMPRRWGRRQKRDKNWYQDKHNTLLIVATLIATVTFAAGLSPPGGVWDESKVMNEEISPSPSPFMESACSNSKRISIYAGTAIQKDCHSDNFKLFMYFDLSGLVSSLFIILFLVSGLPLKNNLTTWILVITMWVAVTSVIMAFIFGTVLIVDSETKIAGKLLCILIGWTAFMVILLFWHLVVLIFHLILRIVHLIFWIIHLIPIPKFLKSTRLSLWMKNKFQRGREEDRVQV